MSSRNGSRSGRLRDTAAWRFSAPATVAFALGSLAAYGIAYMIVARGVRQRTDAWLRGETALLADVVRNAESGMEERLVEEVAELATHEVQPAVQEDGLGEQPVFFLVQAVDGTPSAWVGPRDQRAFLAAIHEASFLPGQPLSVDVPQWPHPFRVNMERGPQGVKVYLGLLDHDALKVLAESRRSFVILWIGTMLLGFAVSWLSARRILRRVEEITEAAGRIGSSDLHRRVPQAQGRDEIAGLASTFNAMLGRLEASMEQLRTLGDALAHDLRSPVTSIRGNLELALTSGDERRLQEAAAGSLEGLDRIVSTLQSTLDVAEAEAGVLRLDRKRIDLADLVRRLVDLYRPAAEERGLTLDVVGSEAAIGDLDADLVGRAVANLMDNAVRHVPAGCRVEVAVRALPDGLELLVCDNGPGFPPGLRKRIFERFVRGSDSSGSGIGLSLVRAVALAHGGDARVVDEARHGACIRLFFPQTA
jgi:signal transduction histidine kinase